MLNVEIMRRTNDLPVQMSAYYNDTCVRIRAVDPCNLLTRVKTVKRFVGGGGTCYRVLRPIGMEHLCDVRKPLCIDMR
jgi:hypothetical protein